MSATDKKIKIFKPLDILVIIIILFVAVSYLMAMIFYSSSDDLSVVIRENGDIVYQCKLSDIDEKTEITAGENLKVKVLIEKDGATVTESECDNKICVNTGKLTRAGSTAVCLPAKVTVTLVSGSENSLDATVG
ncbi:MAG: NusG domain II-containing protein [Acutalibacteraceae bacterium]